MHCISAQNTLVKEASKLGTINELSTSSALKIPALFVETRPEEAFKKLTKCFTFGLWARPARDMFNGFVMTAGSHRAHAALCL